jgi:hypothetical protein
MVHEALKTEEKLDGLLALCRSGKFVYFCGFSVMFSNLMFYGLGCM